MAPEMEGEPPLSGDAARAAIPAERLHRIAEQDSTDFEKCLRNIRAPLVVGIALLIQPVVAGLLGWLVFGETLTPIQALGGALVLGAVVLAQRSQRAKPTSADVQPG